MDATNHEIDKRSKGFTLGTCILHLYFDLQLHIMTSCKKQYFNLLTQFFLLIIQ